MFKQDVLLHPNVVLQLGPVLTHVVIERIVEHNQRLNRDNGDYRNYERASDVLMCAFTWSKQPEGSKFWLALHDMLQSRE